MKILFLGDIVGDSGCIAVKKHLQTIIEKNKINFVIANGENAAIDGVGITENNVKELISSGVDVITTGNHVWDQKETFEFIKKENLNLKIPPREEIVKCFEEFYFGGDPNKDSKYWSGFIVNEELLVDKKFFDLLESNGIIWGFVSGAESASAKFVLEKRLGLKSPPLISMGDAPEKPNPRGFINLSKKLLGDRLGASNIPIAYVGDTIADINTVVNARKEIPSQKFISIGIAPPHLHLKSRVKERNAYERNLQKVGADLILSSINDLKNINLNQF